MRLKDRCIYPSKFEDYKYDLKGYTKDEKKLIDYYSLKDRMEYKKFLESKR